LTNTRARPGHRKQAQGHSVFGFFCAKILRIRGQTHLPRNEGGQARADHSYVKSTSTIDRSSNPA